MLLNFTQSNPLWVTDPHSGVTLNVAPLFVAMTEFDGEVPSPEKLARSIYEAIQLINLTVHDPDKTPLTSVVNVNFDLFRLQEAFEAMSKKPDIPMVA